MAGTKADFSQGDVRRLILSQALPLTVAQLVQLAYNIVDRVYIGHLEGIGELALTGLGITFPVIVLIAAFTMLFGGGGATLFALARGQGQQEEAESVLANAFTLLLMSAGVLFAICYIWRRPILFLFGASENSFVYADEYLKIYLLGTAFSMVATGMNGYINAQGFPRIGMLTTVLGAVINVILDPIFIFVLDMGVRGAALATFLSQGISAAWVMCFLLGKKAVVALIPGKMKLRSDLVVRIIQLGIPGFAAQGTNSLVQIICNNQLQLYGGDLFVGIMTIISSVREMVSVPLFGLFHGCQPIMGYNYGAGEFRRVKQAIRFSTTVGAIYLLLAWAAVMLVPRQLMSIFTDDPATITQGARMLNIYFFGFAFMALQSGGQSVFQSLERAKQATFFSLLRKAFIVVPLTVALPAIGFGVEGVFLAEPISNALGGIAAFTTMYFTVYKKLDPAPGKPE